MAYLIVRRSGGFRDLLRAYVVVIDGIVTAKVRVGSACHLRIAEGAHVVTLSVDGYGSQALSILACDQAVTVIGCKPGTVPARDVLAGSERRDSYIEAWIEDQEDCLRAYVQAAVRAGQRMLRDKDPPGRLSRFGLSAGDISVLAHASRQADAQILTCRGTMNEVVWRKLEEVGWLVGIAPPPGPVEMSLFRITPYGRIELLDLF